MTPDYKNNSVPVVAFVTLVMFALLTGCGNSVSDLGYTPTERPLDDTREKAGQISSQILDMIDLKNGKVTEPGPGVSFCEEDPEHLYKIRHPWSVYNAPEEELKRGFQRLRESLPKNHWKIVEYGPNNSKSKTLELTADYQKDKFSINVALWVSSPSAGREKEPKILVHVVSACFRAPKGTKLDQEY